LNGRSRPDIGFAKTCIETLESKPRIRLSARNQLKAQVKKARFSHTLCTCGADASRTEFGYPIGVRRPFSVEHCLHVRLRALTANRETWRKSISSKDLRASDAITAGGSSFCRRSDARLHSVCPGRSRPTKSSGPSLDGARQRDPREHRIDGDARGEVRDERLAADAARGGDGKASVRSARLSGGRSFLLALSRTCPQVDPTRAGLGRAETRVG
jgi:hypothetical protein